MRGCASRDPACWCYHAKRTTDVKEQWQHVLHSFCMQPETHPKSIRPFLTMLLRQPEIHEAAKVLVQVCRRHCRLCIVCGDGVDQEWQMRCQNSKDPERHALDDENYAPIVSELVVASLG
jgi:hypothetical protein